ncbi:MAG: alpha-2-macroglobulin family protein [Fibrobacterota bacterium]
MFNQRMDWMALDAEVKTTVISFSGVLNRRERRPIYMDTLIGARPGIVFMQVNDSTGIGRKGNPAHKRALLQVTNIDISAKFGYDNNLIAVTRLDNGQPIGKAIVELRDINNKIIWVGKTNTEGKALSPSWWKLSMVRQNHYAMPEQIILVYNDKDLAFLSSEWDVGISPWRFGLEYQGDQIPKQTYLGTMITERDLYRPGEMAFGKGFVRFLENESWQPVKHTKVVMTVRGEGAVHAFSGEEGDEEGGRAEGGTAILYEDTVALSKIGAFEFKFRIPKEAKLGVYTMQAHVVGFEEDMSKNGFREQIKGSLRVAEFKPAELEVHVVPSVNDAMYGDSVSGVISSNYLFGAPVKDEPVLWAVRRFTMHFKQKGYEDWTFENWADDERRRTEDPPEGRLMFKDSTNLDSKGMAKVGFRIGPNENGTPAYYQLEATVTGKSSQPIASWKSIAVHPADCYVGIRLSDYFITAAMPMKIHLATLTPQGKRVAGQKIALKVICRYWTSVLKLDLEGRRTWQSERKDSVCLSDTLLSADYTGDTVLFVPTRTGYYIVKATVLSNGKESAAASTGFYACGSDYVPWERTNDDVIDVVSDKKTYEPGDLAKLLVKSPYPESRALLTVEREGVILSKWITLHGTAARVDLPITRDFLPNVYVSVMILRGRASEQRFDEDGNDLSKPAFKIGYCQFDVEPSGKHLKVQVESAKPEFKPGDSAEVKIIVPQLAKKTYASDVLVMVVDEAVLMLSGFKTPDPFQVFYNTRPLCVLTGELRSTVIGERNYGEKGENRGGSGGVDPALLARLNDMAARGNFKVCAYFNPRVVLNKEGKATVRFKLPDNLTTFRIMAVAQSALAEFGSGEARIRVNKKLMLRPFLPRFLRVGDTCLAGVVGENYTGAADTVKVRCESQGVKLSGGSFSQACVQPNSNAYLLIPMVADALADSVSLVFKGVLGAETDGVAVTLPLVYERSLETVAMTGSTADSARQLVKVPAGTDERFGGVQASLSSTALIGLGESVNYLFEYPYGCLEQRTSRILPIILFQEMIKAFAGKVPKNMNGAELIREYLGMVTKYQCPNGGFDYWTPAKHDSPYITAYTLLAIIRAGNKGYSVDPESRTKAINYLSDCLNGQLRRNEYPYNETEWRTTLAFITAVLAEAGIGKPGVVEDLFKHRNQLTAVGLSWLYKAIVLGKNDPKMGEQVKTDIMNFAKIEAASLHFEERAGQGNYWIHSSNVHSTSVILLNLLESDGKFLQAEKAVRWLMEKQRNNRWGNTHENFFAFWATAAYFNAYEKETPDFTAKIRLDGKEWLTEKFAGRQSESRMTSQSLTALPKDRNLPMDFVKQGPGRLYYQFRMKYAPAGKAEARDEGLFVDREYQTLEGKPLKPEEFKVGQMVLVRLTVKTTRERHFVAVNDAVPAGCEIIDPTLSVVSSELKAKLTAFNRESRSSWWGSWNHVEYRDQRCLLFADVLDAGAHTFAYLVRPSITGSFGTPATHAEAMYEPEIFGRSAECLTVIKK